jgi:hypothetical protein
MEIPAIIVLGCPECQTDLLRHAGEVYDLNILKQTPEALQFMDNDDISNMIKNNKEQYEDHKRNERITNDELINLKIDLESTMDVNDFLKTLEK